MSFFCGGGMEDAVRQKHLHARILSGFLAASDLSGQPCRPPKKDLN